MLQLAVAALQLAVAARSSIRPELSSNGTSSSLNILIFFLAGVSFIIRFRF